MGSFYQAHRSCIQSTEIKYSTFVRQALLQRKRWPESRNLSFFPCLSCRFISRYCFSFAAATAQSPVMAVEGPGRTKSSTPLDLSCWEITPCSLAGLKEFPAKPYPCCPQLLPERVPDFSSLRGAGRSRRERNHRERAGKRSSPGGFGGRAAGARPFTRTCGHPRATLGSCGSCRAAFLGGELAWPLPEGAAAGGELAEQEFAPSRGL